MKKMWSIMLLATMASFSLSAGQGCVAQAGAYFDDYYCTGPQNKGRCSIIIGIGQPETSYCVSTYASAECEKYASDGTLLVSKREICYVF